MTKPRGPTAKSLRTRQLIEDAARDLFAHHGFERATVRDIAAQAGIDASMVIRYFGSKDALFARVARPDLDLPDLGQVDPTKFGEALVRHFLAQWENDAGRGGLPVLLRSAASNHEAANTLQQTFATQVLPMVARAGPPETTAQRAGLVATQLLGLALTRYVLKLPPVVAMSAEVLIAEVGATVQRYATGR
jgi:AcrR family transcriptional regulator